MKYQGIIKKGEKNKAIVKAIQRKLNEKGCGPLIVDGDFGNLTNGAVKTFQIRNTDVHGNSLLADGIVGAITWSVLFDEQRIVTPQKIKSVLLRKALDIAVSEIGTVEIPPHSNRGPRVDQYIISSGLNPGNYAWCAAFVYWCFNEAALQLNTRNPAVRTPGVLKHWNQTTGKKIIAKDALEIPDLIKPGLIFIIDFGRGYGHTGIVENVNSGYLTTIEGNTNTAQSREGNGVFRLTRRKIKDINKGFIDYSES